MACRSKGSASVAGARSAHHSRLLLTLPTLPRVRSTAARAALPQASVATGLAGLLLLGGGGGEQPPTLLPRQLLHSSGQLARLATTNPAITGQLRLRQKGERYGGSSNAPSTLARRFSSASEQLLRIELLARAGEAQNARLQLREGACKTLRMDLGYGQELTRVVKPQVTRDIVAGLEQLDAQLKARQGSDVIRATVSSLRSQLDGLAELLADVAQ